MLCHLSALRVGQDLVRMKTPGRNGPGRQDPVLKDGAKLKPPLRGAYTDEEA